MFKVGYAAVNALKGTKIIKNYQQFSRLLMVSEYSEEELKLLTEKWSRYSVCIFDFVFNMHMQFLDNYHIYSFMSRCAYISITDIPVQSTTIRVAEAACDLGVIIDSKLSLSACFYHLRQLRPVLRSLTHEAARTLSQVFMSSRLHCSNSLLYGLPHL